MTGRRSWDIALWVLWGAGAAVVVIPAVLNAIDQPGFEASLPRITDSLLAPISILAIGYAMWHRFEPVERFAAALAAISVIFSIALLSLQATAPPDWPFPTRTDWWTEATGMVVQIVFIVAHLMGTWASPEKDWDIGETPG